MVGVFDSEISGASLADESITHLFSDAAEISALLLLESQLALVQDDLGIIPTGYGRTISTVLESIVVDPETLSAGYGKDGIAVPALIEFLREQLPAEVRNYLHWGTTSQDIIDSALSLRLKTVSSVIAARLDNLIKLLADLTHTHRHTLMVARTRYQVAAPTVFGLKTAGWLAPLLRQRIRLNELLPRLLVLQFGGAAGTLAALGTRGRNVSALLAEKLGLACPELPWHAQRDNLVEFSNWLALTSGAIGKMGQDLLLMNQSEVGEVSFSNAGGSSAMPQKANPVLAETLVGIARNSPGQASSMQQAMVQSHERDGVGMTLEALALPDLVCAGASSLLLAGRCIESLQVHENIMLENISASNGLVLAEAASYELANFLDRDSVSALLRVACETARRTDTHMIDELARLTEFDIDWQYLKQPENYLGVADEFISALLKAIPELDSRQAESTGAVSKLNH